MTVTASGERSAKPAFGATGRAVSVPSTNQVISVDMVHAAR
jgi:hypothetical protein